MRSAARRRRSMPHCANTSAWSTAWSLLARSTGAISTTILWPRRPNRPPRLAAFSGRAWLLAGGYDKRVDMAALVKATCELARGAAFYAPLDRDYTRKRRRRYPASAPRSTKHSIRRSPGVSNNRTRAIASYFHPVAPVTTSLPIIVRAARGFVHSSARSRMVDPARHRVVIARGAHDERMFALWKSAADVKNSCVIEIN